MMIFWRSPFYYPTCFLELSVFLCNRSPSSSATTRRKKATTTLFRVCICNMKLFRDRMMFVAFLSSVFGSRIKFYLMLYNIKHNIKMKLFRMLFFFAVEGTPKLIATGDWSYRILKQILDASTINHLDILTPPFPVFNCCGLR